MKTIHHLIDGVASPGASGVTKPVFNPATGEQTASLAMASLAEVDAAVASSQAAFQEWRHVSLARRHLLLYAMKSCAPSACGLARD